MSVRIPIYEQGSSVSGLAPNQRASGLPIDDSISKAMGNLSAGFAAVGQGMAAQAAVKSSLLHQQAEEDGKAYAGKALSDAHVVWQQALQDRQADMLPGAPGFTPTVLQDYDEWSQTAIAQAPTPAAKRYLNQHLVSYRSQLAGDALAFESHARLGLRTDEFTKSVENWAVAAARDPSKYDRPCRYSTETLPAVGPLQQEKLREFARKTLT